MAKVTVVAETITPAMALRYLEQNKNNRSIRDLHVEMLARDMRDGRWQFNGDTVKFDVLGNLADGQHRLWAIVHADTPQKMLVVRGVAESAYDTIDTGSPRTAGDALHRQGFRIGPHVAACVRVLHWYDKGHHRAQWSTHRRMTHTEIVNYAKSTEDLQGAVNRVKNSAKLRSMSAGAGMASVYYLARQLSPALAEAFISGVETGEGMDAGDPRLTLRNWMYEVRTQSRRMDASLMFGFIMKAFNYYAEAKPLRVLKFMAEEEIPAILKKSHIKRVVVSSADGHGA